MQVLIDNQKVFNFCHGVEYHLLLDGKGSITSTGFFENADQLRGNSIFSYLDDSCKEEFFNCFIKSKAGNQITCQLPVKDELSETFLYDFQLIPLRRKGQTDEISLIIKRNQTLERKQDSFEKTITDVTRQLSFVKPHQFDEVLNNVLKYIGGFTQVDRVYLFLFDPYTESYSNIYEWCSHKAAPQIDHLQQVSVNDMNWMHSWFKKNDSLVIKNVSDIPSIPDRHLLQDQDIQSMLAVPVNSDKLSGFIGFDAVTEREWHEQEIDLLKVAGKLFFDSIEKKHLMDELSLLAFNYKQIFKNAHDAILILDIDTEKVITFNDRASEMYGYPPEQLTGMSMKDLSANKDNGPEQIEKLKENKHVTFETVQFRKNGAVMFLEVYASLITYNNKLCILSINRDITKRKIAEKKANVYNSRLQTVFNLISDYTFSFHIEGKDVKAEWLSNSVYDDFKIDEEIKWNRIVHPKDQDKVRRLYGELKKNKKITAEFRVINKYRKPKWIEITCQVTSAADSSIMKIVGSAKNITKRKKAELALADSESMYKELFENTSEGIFIHDLTGKFLQVNQVACRQLGYTKSEMLKMSVKDIDTPEFADIAKKRIEELMYNQKLIFESAHQRKDGKIIPVELNSRLIRYKNNITILSTSRDITKKKQAENRLKRELDINTAISFLAKDILTEKFNVKKLLKDILDYLLKSTESDEGIIVEIKPNSDEALSETYTQGFPNISNFDITDSGIHFERINGEYDKFWGYALNTCEPFYTNDIMNHNITKGVNKDEVPFLNMLAVPAVVENKLMGQIILLKSDKKYADEDLDLVKRISDVMALAMHKEHYVKELSIRNNELNNFVYKVSHDLRGPVASIEGLVDLMRMNQPDIPCNSYLNLLQNRVRKLDDFIRNVLSHSRNLNTTVDIGHIDFKELISACYDELLYLSDSEKIEKIIEIEGADYHNDRIRIYEIFRNLLSNGIKYTDHTKNNQFIKIKVITNTKNAFIEISDNGIGIDSQVIPKIFDMFYRGSERSESSGLGLYIVKQAVEKIGGEIKVKSKEGKGTVFSLMLPNLVEMRR